jgi:hypothetical protein
VWKKCFGGTGFDSASSLQQTTDDGFIVAGTSNSGNEDVTGNNGSYDYWIVKLDMSGILGGKNPLEEVMMRQHPVSGKLPTEDLLFQGRLHPAMVMFQEIRD